MRENLKPYIGKRTRFTGKVDRFGTKSGWEGRSIKTVCLNDIKSPEGKIVTDHLWLKIGKQLEALQLQVGDLVCFHARADYYETGYRGRRDDEDLPPLRTDIGLCYPTNVTKIATVPGNPAQRKLI